MVKFFALTTEQDDVLTSAAQRDHALTLTAEHDGIFHKRFATLTLEIVLTLTTER